MQAQRQHAKILDDPQKQVGFHRIGGAETSTGDIDSAESGYGQNDRKENQHQIYGQGGSP